MLDALPFLVHRQQTHKNLQRLADAGLTIMQKYAALRTLRASYLSDNRKTTFMTFITPDTLKERTWLEYQSENSRNKDVKLENFSTNPKKPFVELNEKGETFNYVFRNNLFSFSPKYRGFVISNSYPFIFDADKRLFLPAD